MAQSIIDALFNGKVMPYEQIGVTGDDEYEAINRNIREEKEYFKSKLTEQDRQRLEAFESLFSQSSSIQNVETFRYGFRLGVMIMVEIFTGKDLFAPKVRPGETGE